MVLRSAAEPVALQLSFVCNTRQQDTCFSMLSYVTNATETVAARMDFYPEETNAVADHALFPGGHYAELRIKWDCSQSSILDMRIQPTPDSATVPFATTRLEVPCLDSDASTTLSD